MPAAAQAAQALVRWRALRRPANVLAAIDTSGSMAEQAPGLPVTKLAVFQKAAAQAVTLFNARSRLGLWEFSSLLDGPRDYKQLVPARPLAARVGRVDQRALIIGTTARMRAVGNTGLYDTIDAGYRPVLRSWRADQQNILVVMTDGKNEDLAGLSLPQLVSSLRAQVEPEAPGHRDPHRVRVGRRRGLAGQGRGGRARPDVLGAEPGRHRQGLPRRDGEPVSL